MLFDKKSVDATNEEVLSTMILCVDVLPLILGTAKIATKVVFC